MPKIFSFESVSSTIDKTFELLSDKKIEKNQIQIEKNCIVVTAQFQEKGRGRNNKTWFSSKNENLYYTFGIKHSSEEIPLYIFQIIGGLAAFKCLESLTVQEISGFSKINNLIKSEKNFNERINKGIEGIFRLKYPNDVYAIEKNLTVNTFTVKKISGIISETNFINKNDCQSIIGIGINVEQTAFPAEIRENATSLKLLGIEAKINDLTKKLTDLILELLAKPYCKVFAEWKSILNLENKEISVISNENNSENKDFSAAKPQKTYKLKEFFPDGRLLLVAKSGEEKIINSGDSIRYNLL